MFGVKNVVGQVQPEMHECTPWLKFSQVLKREDLLLGCFWVAVNGQRAEKRFCKIPPCPHKTACTPSVFTPTKQRIQAWTLTLSNDKWGSDVNCHPPFSDLPGDKRVMNSSYFLKVLLCLSWTFQGLNCEFALAHGGTTAWRGGRALLSAARAAKCIQYKYF